MEQRIQNLTKGNIYKMLAVFALPYLMANFIQALYGAVDIMVVGWFNDAAVVASENGRGGSCPGDSWFTGGQYDSGNCLSEPEKLYF